MLAAALRNGVPDASERPRLAETAADLADSAAQAAAMLGRVTEREVVTLREMAAKTRENWPWFRVLLPLLPCCWRSVFDPDFATAAQYRPQHPQARTWRIQ